MKNLSLQLEELEAVAAPVDWGDVAIGVGIGIGVIAFT